MLLGVTTWPPAGYGVVVEETTAATALAVIPGSLLAASAMRLWCSRCDAKGSAGPPPADPLLEIELEFPPGLLP